MKKKRFVCCPGVVDIGKENQTSDAKKITGETFSGSCIAKRCKVVMVIDQCLVKTTRAPIQRTEEASSALGIRVVGSFSLPNRDSIYSALLFYFPIVCVRLFCGDRPCCTRTAISQENCNIHCY